MRRIYFFALFFGLLLGPGLPAQQALPDRFATWTAKGEAAPAADWPEGSASILKEAGLVGAASRVYINQGRELKLMLYTMRDPSGAYAVYTWLRSPEMIDSDLAAHAAVGRDRAVLISGRTVVEASGISRADIAELRELVRLLDRDADQTPLPPIRSYLPLKGKIAGTERYAIGPAGFSAAMQATGQPELAVLAEKAGFASGAEAVLARYRAGRETVGLLLLEYPTPQSAGKHQKHIESTLAGIAQGTDVSVRRTGSLLSVVLPPAGTPAEQEALLDAVRFETNLTWNEPSSTFTDPSWPVIVVNTMIGTGVFLVGAVVFGIAFGGLRLLTKRLFPGKVFDRASRMQILQLALNSKAINSDDFYASWNPRNKS